jgi:DNA-binding HxlR family transcriptional regulator
MKSSSEQCGLEATLFVVGGKWKLLILFHLQDRPRRFGELRRLVEGVSEKMLIQQLRELRMDGIVDRMDFKELPPRVEYSITSHGRTLGEALMPLCSWGLTYGERITARRRRLSARLKDQAESKISVAPASNYPAGDQG